MAKAIDFWGASGVDFDATKALQALQAKVSQSVKEDPDFFMDAPRLSLALQTKPRSAESKPEQSVFQAFKGITVQDLKRAGVRCDVERGLVTFTGFSDDSAGMASLDTFLTDCGALRRTTVSRTKGWPFISDPVLASTPKLAPTDRVGSIVGARQVSIALPPKIASALPNWASAAGMVGFFCEVGALGLTVTDLEAFLQAKRDANNAE